jgi:hypothetical protein
MDKKFYEDSARFLRIGNRAVRKAQEENRRLGLPNVYELAGNLVWVYPDGTTKSKKLGVF